MIKKRSVLSNVLLFSCLIILAVIIVFPIYMMLAMGLFSMNDTNEIPRRFFPTSLNFSNYVEAFSLAGDYVDDFGNVGLPYMVLYIKNTITVLVIYVVGVVVMSSITAYAFSKIKFKGRNKLFFITLTTMMIPGSVTMVPMFTVFKTLGWLDSLIPLCVPIWFGGGVTNIFLIRQFMKGIPNSILESAEIDGASHIKRCFWIVVPLCKPILMYVAMTSVFAVWNDFFSPLLYVNTKSKWTLALGIANIVQTNDSAIASKKHLLMAACTIMTIFPTVIFALGQKLFLESVTFSGIKD